MILKISFNLPLDGDSDTLTHLTTDPKLTSKLGFDYYFIKLRDNEASTPFAIVGDKLSKHEGCFLLHVAYSLILCSQQPPLLHYDACDCVSLQITIIGVMKRNKKWSITDFFAM